MDVAMLCSRRLLFLLVSLRTASSLACAEAVQDCGDPSAGQCSATFCPSSLRKRGSAPCLSVCRAQVSHAESANPLNCAPMTNPPLELGAFRLLEPIGRGGMGEVWRAQQRGQSQPVALKIVALEDGTQSSLEGFRQEVRAVAALDHPAIVQIYDHGLVPAQVASLSAGRIPAQAAWFAMELAEKGSLAQHKGMLPWQGLREVLLALLDALAHAHARGVIHRDLKPANVLFAQGLEGDEIKLSDFGLAHALGRTRGSTSLAGTPTHMAPEQFLGRWRAFGPWTDLYALGCMAWEMSCGRPLFEGKEVSQQMQAHLQEEPGFFRPTVDVPIGLESWLRCLLSKRPEDRFQRAADAAYALLGLPQETEVKGHTPALVSESPPTQALTWASLGPGDTLIHQLKAPAWEPLPNKGQALRCKRVLAPLPEHPGVPALSKSRPGLGLLGLKSPALLDREEERKLLWSELQACRNDGQTRMVILQGAAGIGKSRLCRWLSERAHELGAAEVFRATHTATGGPSEGLTGLLAEHLHALGLSRQGLRSILEERMGRNEALRMEALALTELLRPMGPKAGPRSAKERHGLVRGVMDRARKSGLEEGARVVILWLDDVQWGRDALSFAKRLLTETAFAALPMLILATARKEGIESGPKAQLRELSMLGRCTRRVLGPLPPKEQRALVREQLGLVGELAKTVERHAAGNPLFAQQLVGELVQRGALVDRGQGFALRPGAELVLPEDLVQAWLARTQALLQDRPPIEATLLGLAAALGTRIQTREWHLAARAWGLPQEDLEAHCGALVERLARRNLARRESQGWRFEHGMLREAILRREQSLGHLPALHRACALGLERRYGDAPDLQERLGLHFIGAGEPEQAIAPLERAYLYARSNQDLESVRALVKARMGAMSSAGVSYEDPRWIRGWMAASFVARSSGHFHQHRRVLRKALKLAERGGHERLCVRILRHLAEGERQQGHAAIAREHFDEVLPRVQALGDPLLEAKIVEGQANCARQLHQSEEAEALILRAQRLFIEVGDLAGQATCHRGLGNLARNRGELETAALEVNRALKIYERIGQRLGMANCLNDLGDFHRFQGHNDAARNAYKRSRALYDSVGSYAALYARFNLALLRLMDQAYISCSRELERLLRASGQAGLVVLRAGIQLALAACMAAESDWPRFHALVLQAKADLQASGDLDHDNAWPARVAGELAQAAGKPELALLAYQVALHQFVGIGAQRLSGEVQALIQGLEEPDPEPLSPGNG